MAHKKLDVLSANGSVILRDGPAIPPEEWERLEYVDWKSGGDTNFAPLASARGEMECAGFWDHGKPDKDGMWTANREIAPTLCSYVEAVGARFGRVRVIKLNPSSEADALRQLHQDDNNRLNPDGEGWVVRAWLELNAPEGSTFILREVRDDPVNRDPHPAASAPSAGARYRAAVSRRAQPRTGATLCVDHLVRVWRASRTVDRIAAPGGCAAGLNGAGGFQVDRYQHIRPVRHVYHRYRLSRAIKPATTTKSSSGKTNSVLQFTHLVQRKECEYHVGSQSRTGSAASGRSLDLMFARRKATTSCRTDATASASRLHSSIVLPPDRDRRWSQGRYYGRRSERRSDRQE